MSKSSALSPVIGETTVTAAGTRQPLATGSPDEIKGKKVTVKALSTNAGKVYIGDHTVASTNGYPLNADEQKCFEGAINLATIYVDVDNNGEGVRYLLER